MQFTTYELNSKKAYLEELKAKANDLRQGYAHAMATENDNSMSSGAARNLRIEIEVIEDQINALTAEINSAEIIDIVHTETVDYGATVKVRFYYPDEIEDEVLIVSNDTGFISKGMVVCTPSSPLFKFIQGKPKGYRGTFKEDIRDETVKYDFEILEISY